MTRRVALRLPRLTIDPNKAVNLFAIAAAAVIAGLALAAEGGVASNGRLSDLGASLASPPEPPPFLLRNVSPQDAVSINQGIPFSLENNFPAQPFRFSGDEEARGRALECLALAIYYEAGSQDQAGQEAVAQVILNRVRHPAFPQTICGVVFQGFTRSTGCQFTFTCDGSLLRAPNRTIWDRAREIAGAALDGAVFKPVGLATHYHADYVVPYWATSLAKNAQVGAHIFYRWRGGWGRPTAFLRKYPGKELDPRNLRSAAIIEEGAWPEALAAPTGEPGHMAVDPRVELLSVVQTLAAGQPEKGERGRYEADIRSYFQPEAEHAAVQQFKSLREENPGFTAAIAEILLRFSEPSALARIKAPSPELLKAVGGEEKLTAFMTALQDFSATSDFQRFFKGHSSYYRNAVRTAVERAETVRAQWQTYAGSPLEGVDLTITPLLTTSRACGLGDGRARALSLYSLASGDNASETMLTLAADQEALAFSKPMRALAPLQEQIIRAVFTRIAALSEGSAAGEAAVRRELGAGHLLVAVFDQRLRYYEAHRDQFATLTDFLPRLLEGVSEAQPKSAAKQCEATVVAKVEPVSQVQNVGS